MQTTQDLPSASAAVFRELQALNFEGLITAIGEADLERDLISQWTVLPADYPEDVGHFAPFQVYDSSGIQQRAAGASARRAEEVAKMVS